MNFPARTHAAFVIPSRRSAEMDLSSVMSASLPAEKDDRICEIPLPPLADRDDNRAAATCQTS